MLKSTNKLFNELWDEDSEADPLKYVRKHRKLDCENYDLCLDVAVALGWPSFSCSQCNGEGPDDVQLYVAAERLLSGEDPYKKRYKAKLFREYYVKR